MNIIKGNSKNECSGCGSCIKACNTNCITINRNELGFYSPVVNENCTSCGMCKTVCYKFINSNDENSINESKPYLAYSLDSKIRKVSSSGGIGNGLTQYAITNGYEVCGVTYDYDENNAKHIIITNLDECEKIIGSKYIPSFTGDAFSKLDKAKKYMIVGTPCQIYGLRKLQEIKKLDNIILVDFFCHGTPSLNLWDKYLDMIKSKYNILKIDKVNFRDKQQGWHNYNMVIEGETKVFRKNFKEDIFSHFFLENVDLNEACYECKLRFDKVYSDIRLGDFWGSKCCDDEKGTSIVLSNTPLGEDILKSLGTIHLEQVTFNELKESQYVESLVLPRERYGVQVALRSNERLENIYEKYVLPIKKRKKVEAIISYPIRKVKGLIRRCKKWGAKV